MGIGVGQRISMGVAVVFCAVTMLPAQGPPGGGGRGAPPPAQTPAVQQADPTGRRSGGARSRPRVVGEPLHRLPWLAGARVGHRPEHHPDEDGQLRSVRGRAGSVLGPFLKAGHPTQSSKPSASFTDDEVVGLANFLRQRVNDTMRGSPLFTVGDIVVGDAKAGEAYFNGDGGCATCHTATDRNLAGIATRIPVPVDLQQRMLFPGGGGRGRGRGGAERRRRRPIRPAHLRLSIRTPSP